jgi:hypothetical protein
MLKVAIVGLFTLILVGSASAQATCPNRGQLLIVRQINAGLTACLGRAIKGIAARNIAPTTERSGDDKCCGY